MTYYKLCNHNFIVQSYGISQESETGNCVVVMDYVKGGNLRQYLQNNYKELKLEDKIKQLYNIANGLGFIHKAGLIHRDFHPGNILSDNGRFFITDLGLSKPVKEQEYEERVYGVLPYVAPEVLRDKFYTQASDVYSFGVVAYEILSGLSPYCGMAREKDLALSIHKGLRPKLSDISAPQLLKDLIRKC